MIKNYIKIAFRNLIVNKFFSIINLLGFTIGITISVLIFVWLKHETSFDRFHTNSKYTYRTLTVSEKGTGNGSPAPLGPTLKDEIPYINSFCRFKDFPTVSFKVGDFVDYESKGLSVDSTFFDMFSFDILYGNAYDLFKDPFQIIITEEMSKKYFGAKDPVGESILIHNSDYFKVVGVLKSLPTNTHLDFDFLLPYRLVTELQMCGLAWGDFNFRTYIQINDNVDIIEDSLINQMNRIAINHKCPQVYRKMLSLSVQKLEDIYLNPCTYYDLPNLGNKTNVYLFSAIGILIIFIACFNYINLSTAKAEKRFKEAGLRKVVGATKSQLIIQFISESVLLSIISVNFAILLAYRLLPIFQELTGNVIQIRLNEISFIIFIILIVFVTGILAGIYPAWYISRANAIDMVKSAGHTTKGKLSKGYLRKVLVITQFAIAISLIIVTLFVNKQLKFMWEKSWSLQDDYIIHIPIKENIGDKYELVKSKLLNHTEIKSVSVKNCLPTSMVNNTSGVWWEGKTEEHDKIFMETTRIGYDYFKTMGIDIVEGRSFSPAFKTDSSISVILNEKALELSGITDPIGKTFGIYNMKGSIVGIAKNTLFHNAKREIHPQVFHFLSNPKNASLYGTVLIRINGKTLSKRNTSSVITYIENIWNEINTYSPFEYHFLDETIEKQYISEIKMRNIFFYFAFFAIFISCLGMLGLSFYITDSKTKEIGIRKVLGASSGTINKIFTFDFLRNVFLSILISWPLAYYFIKNWLQSFSIRTEINLFPFVLATIIALVIALLTVSAIVYRASNQNPVKSLRYE